MTILRTGKSFFPLIAACLLACPALAQASSYKIFEPGVEVRPEQNSCLGEIERVASINLSPQDHERLQLANAYTEHMKADKQDPRVIKALYRASLKTGVDFDLLLMKAILESDLGRYNAAARSSARGVFQYIEPTWLILIKRYGDKIGYPEYAKAIQISRREGFPYFKGNDKYLREEILALRYDDNISAMIKAYQIIEETDVIRGYKNGGAVTATDHYVAHMLGLKLAKDLYDLMNRNSIFAVARLNNPQMREAAMLNRNFFYDNKTPLTAHAVYRKFESRVDREMQRIRSVGRRPVKEPDCMLATTQ